ncbi:ATP-binding protein [Solirubrobacter soli]|uniref:ATP-binding protein n=1 Tax=Solirubrobacter soli TaxID=363832 RepID=UPI00042896C0|nr:ATP-binding protein [Solirubrobacter soli]
MGNNGWLVGDGEIVELIRSKDWSQTALGPIEDWPESLQTTVSLSLASSFPINVIWGPGAVQIWNEAYSKVCGDKHPREFASDYRECWASAWPAIGGAFETARAGETAFLENQPMFLDRNGYLEETWFTFSLSPIRDESGQVVGLFHPVTETTPRMLSDRRTHALRDLAACAVRARTVGQATELSLEVLAGFRLDLPFLALYLVDGETAHVAGRTGLRAGHPLTPELIDVADRRSAVATVVRTGETVHLTDLTARFGPVHAGPHDEPLEQALLLPVSPPGVERPAGVLVAGVSTRLELDETYRGFFDLVAQGVTSALANALAYEQERARAEALADIDRAKTAFFSNVSHEFRTPLTLMLGPLEEELADPDLNAVGRERLTTAHRNSLRLLRLVNSLLDFSRIESGRAQARYLPTDLAAYTADLASLFRSTIESAGLELVVDCEPLPELVYVDREMWEKVVLNLLSNAFKHTFKGRIGVTLRWTGDGAELAVSDTGIGIPADEIPRLFDRFHRVRDARSRTHEGTGIGLAVVQELTRLHGGEVRIESELGQGSTFVTSVHAGRAHLPADHVGDETEAAVAGAAAAAHLHEAANWLGSDEVVDEWPLDESDERPRILLADDNDDMRRHVARLLRGRFQVTTVPDGEAALQSAVADPPDLVLTDVMMPRLDGFGLLAGLRAHERTRAIPVIMLSARAGEEAAVEGLEAGADDYLIKPFSGRELIARVSATLSLARMREESAQRLEEVNRELAAAAAAKSQFVAGISHEIRTPLNAIIGMTSLLLRSPLNETQAEYAQVLRSSGEHLLNLVGDVLDFSKIEAGAIQLERAPFDVRRCVQDALDIVAVDAGAKQLPLLSHIAPDVPEWVIGDSGRLSQILINLLANAVKFTETGQVTLTLEAGAAGPYLCELRFAIADTGIGISGADQAALFEAFVQVGDSDRRKGTGLGLAISAQLADLLGGAVAVESTLGEGSTFTLTIPAGLVDPPTPAAHAVAPAVEVDATEGLRILIVDDNRANQRVTALLLGELGFAPDTAGNGIEAIEAIERQPYDLVFMDMQMPELSGLEATRIIRRRFPGDRGPIVVGLSGYASNDTRHECLAAGMNHYLVKPVTLDQFAATIAQLTAVPARDG